MTPAADDGAVALLVIVAVCFVIGLAETMIRKLAELIPRLRYLNMEIKRSQGWERRRWKRKKRDLLLSLIPLYSLFKKK